MKKLEPLYDRILIEHVKEDEKKLAIFLPDKAQEKPQYGVVRAAGCGRLEDGKIVPLLVKVGDTVLFGKFSGTSVELDGTTYHFMRENEVFAIIREEEEPAS